MTIHADWARIMRGTCPEAFHAVVPSDVAFDVGVIDGHLQLMCLHAGFGAWDVFLDVMFVRPIQRMLAEGCKTVVLCFDSYEHVPVYKSMTQKKRAQTHASTCSFDAHQSLPVDIPTDAMTYLMNRNFKVRLIEHACALVPAHVKLEADQRLLIDYRRVVAYQAGGAPLGAPVDDLAPMGESDVKFVRYVQRYGNALVHAVDGDYMAIALLYYATCREGPHARNRIFLYRQGRAATPEEVDGFARDGEETDDDEPKGKKRKRTTPTTTTFQPNARKCWVDMQLLYMALQRRMRPSAAPATDPAACVYEGVRLMLCAGTDFSRGLPLIGPKRIWEHLPDVARLVLPQRPEADLGAVEALYRAVFVRHLPWQGRNAPPMAVLPQLRRARKLAKSTVAKLPSDAQVVATLRNVEWVMRYWCAHNSSVETPLDGTNGFARCATTGQITFADLASSSSSIP